MSLQYLVGGAVDYTEGLEGSRFIVTNPNAKKHLRLRIFV
ncbi:Iron-sulfur cluster insertion protein erpA [Raoultella terrigena]|uniref:Iron-sulfur cluster insertion protein erpA n=1 Tax=Raoultella terrigena TaxID=577 RepID=A0A4U9D9B6_RAOTE|nr:Iron-sulfur cluster insertion protein erpA [Raoultella terrigena]